MTTVLKTEVYAAPGMQRTVSNTEAASSLCVRVCVVRSEGAAEKPEERGPQRLNHRAAEPS